jgi:hypothetical protein
MAGDINGHGYLKPEHVFWIEVAECDQESHCSTTVGQLVQHGTKLCR